MTLSVDLVAGLSAEKIRASPDNMRASLVDLAVGGDGIWTGPLAELTASLVAVARVDLCLARLVEGHADAMRILQEAEVAPLDGVYGVWASRSLGTGVTADQVLDGWQLDGELRFASGVDLIDRALVPAWIDAEHHVLLDIPTSVVTAVPDSWKTTAMDASRSFTVRLPSVTVEARSVGSTDFYLNRPGFVVGGLCVAAVWVGGARQLADLVSASLRPFPTTPHQQRHVGLIEQAAWTVQSLLEHAVAELGPTDEAVSAQIARVRTAVVTACDEIIAQVPIVVGPGGLSRNVRLGRALADLAIYIRQHHLDIELSRIGEHAIHGYDLLGE
ncbi:MAG: hypothetical protein ACR2KG_08110 [Nocardioidaceae bacterium]